MIAFIINVLIIVAILGVLIFVHELGHFISAKLSGVRVDAFALGMGPKLISKKVGETEYMLNALPIGGYVKIRGDGDVGEEISEKDLKDPRNFVNIRLYKKLVILLAGVSMNFLLAVLLFYVILIIFGFQWFIPIQYGSFEPTFGMKESFELEYELEEGGIAEEAGFPSKGVIKAVNGTEVSFFDDFKELLGENKGRSVDVDICVDDICDVYSVTPSKDGLINIRITSLGGFVIVSYSGSEKAFSGFLKAYDQVRFYGYVFGGLISDAKDTGDYENVAVSVSSPVGLYVIVDELKDEGVLPLLLMTADLSLTLVIMNLLPIPALDGGRVVLVLVEKIVKRYWDNKIYKKVELILIQTSYIALLLFMLLIVLKDFFYIDRLRELLN